MPRCGARPARSGVDRGIGEFEVRDHHFHFLVALADEAVDGRVIGLMI